MVYYALGYFASKSDDVLKAIDYYKKASQMAPDYCFPNKLEEVLMLQDANRLQPNDSKAWYYLGNFWYGARQHDEAIACWERSVELDDQFPTVLRNLALGYYNKRNRKEDALACLEKAFALDTNDDRILWNWINSIRSCVVRIKNVWHSLKSISIWWRDATTLV